MFQLEGALAGRLLVAPTLRVWTNAQPLTRSVVEIAVNPAGEVVAARLDGRSGLGEADADALGKARGLRFTPRSWAGTQWGEAVFEWLTAPAGNPATAK